ncbi:hypothetical protein DPMN_135066 [Dreissena polymorpha]|uniref:Uncharacterized protein n=1 Tax=Dreissena polymorpha TaxID=45954 RepID=A0A9D4FYB4_DREPO|nr:hypothetical protein DPMN_135066 [Dreissena polymorpha]
MPSDARQAARSVSSASGVKTEPSSSSESPENAAGTRNAALLFAHVKHYSPSTNNGLD